MLNKYSIILFFFVAIIAAGCKPVIYDVISDKSCPPPCWNGLVPGHTTREEALHILNSLHEVNRSTIKDGSIATTNDSIKWTFITESIEKYGEIFITNNVITGFGFFPTNKSLALETIIKSFGEPDNIIAIYHQQEIRYISIFINYQSKGVILWLSINPYDPDEKAIISNDTKIEGFWYIEPDFYNQLMESNYIAGIEPSILENNTHRWTGYGDITPILVETIY